ncbi:hypothetical protein C0J52_06520 [Blattella germanica]|nr:hypothetical protein C0J52_06520 [Blattella germanica]
MARWANAFRRGRGDVNKKRGAGRLQSASDDVHVNAVRALLEEHCYWTCIELAREVGVAPGTILHILKKKLNLRKICARWVPHSLTEEIIWQRMETARLHIERYGHEDKRFLRRIITLDETWNRMFIIAYDFDGVLITHSVPQGNHVNGAYYSYFLEHHLRPAVHRKHPNLLNSHPV